MPEPKLKTINGHQFTITQPYEAGHSLTEIEAKVLNQVRSENISNNMRKAVKEALENGSDIKAVEKEVAEYDAQYEFTSASQGGGREKLDPETREARKIAKDAIRAKLASEGRKLSDVDKDTLQDAIERVSEDEDIRKAAKKAIADKQKLVAASMESLQI